MARLREGESKSDRYVRDEGARPMNVTWGLKTPIPADYLRLARVAV